MNTTEIDKSATYSVAYRSDLRSSKAEVISYVKGSEIVAFLNAVTNSELSRYVFVEVRDAA